VQGQADLLEIVGTLDSACGLTRRLRRGKQEGDEDRNDGNHDKQLDQRETIHFPRSSINTQ
jgi:hypothetical protein